MKTLVTALLPEGGLEALASCGPVQQYDLALDAHLPRALAAHLPETIALITLLSQRVDAELFDKAPKLKVVANYAVGFDNIDVAAASDRGIWVTNTPDVLTEATADLAWAGLLAAARRVVEGDQLMRSGQFSGWAPLLLLGTELHGKTLGIIGFGAIGRAVARRAAGFGMQVIYAERPSLPDRFDLGSVEATARPLETVLAHSDVLSLHTPLTEATHHLLTGDRLDQLKPGVILVNTARGPVVDEAALVARLRAGTIRAAALDVFEREPLMAPGLAELPNVVLLPHLGSATEETRLAMARRAANNVAAVLRGERPPDAVNKL